MKRIGVLVGCLLGMLFLSVVFAQGAGTLTPLPSFDFKAWGGSVSVYAGIVAALVSLLKARIPAL